MLRVLIYALAILHLGPGIAFAVLAFGCDAASPQLGGLCGRNAFSSFAIITLASWAVLGLGLAAILAFRRKLQSTDPDELHRNA